MKNAAELLQLAKITNESIGCDPDKPLSGDHAAATDSPDSNRTVEWNFYIDPKADDLVFRSGVSITLIPLDALY